MLIFFSEPAPIPSAEMMSINRAPPPSPPMPLPPLPPDPVTPSITSNGNAFGMSNDPRSALMEAIRSGTTLKVILNENCDLIRLKLGASFVFIFVTNSTLRPIPINRMLIILEVIF